MLINKEIEEVLRHYHYDFSQVVIATLGNGHINDTYKLSTPNNNFVLQKINHHVFTNPLQLSKNTQLINQYLVDTDYPLLVPQQLQTKNGDYVVKTKQNYWRLMEYIEDSYSVEKVSTPKEAELVARSFAMFSSALSHFSTESLSVIIPNFHDIEFRLSQLREAIKNSKANRLNSCQELTEFCFAQQSFINEVVELSSKLPLRVTHNDTKINNLLFSKVDNNPCAVIDLDTCMPGLIMHDFGDMVRTCCSNLEEDDGNVSAMQFQFDIFEALITSYQKSFGTALSPLEKESLVVGARLLPFIIGVRFLTDYINGDVYFHCSRENHNLDRAKNQFQLFNLVSKATSELKRLIEC